MYYAAPSAPSWPATAAAYLPPNPAPSAYIPVPARHTFSSHAPLLPPPTYVPPPLSSQSRVPIQPPPPPPPPPAAGVQQGAGPAPTASSGSKTQFNDAVRAYVGRTFDAENNLQGISRQELEIKLKEIITDAATMNRLETNDWASHPLPQQLILEQRKRAAMDPLLSYLPPVSVSIPANSSVRPPVGSSLRKRKSSEMANDQDDAVPPWRSNGNKNGSMADRVSSPPSDKRWKGDDGHSFSKSYANLEQRKKRFEDSRSGSHSPSTSQMLRGQSPDSMPVGPVVGRCQKLEKNYFRLTAPPNAEDVRPLEVLKKTLELLKKKWRRDENYTYICDQLKSLRQDLTVQHIKNEFSTTVYETHARIALEKGDLGEYNQCQTQLRSLYQQKLGGHPVEFKAYRILYFIHTRNRTDMNDVLSELTPADKKEPAIKHALDVRSALALGNYHKFFKLYLAVPGMGAYLMDMFVERERLAALSAICKSYKPDVKLRFVTEELGFENDEEAAQFILDHAGEGSAGLLQEKDGTVCLLTGKVGQVFEAARAAAFGQAIRRSLKNDKDQQYKAAPHLSLTAKSAIAIVPPKKVIKALYDYQPQEASSQQLAFRKGDFFHVISREDDSEWYEACNPLVPSARGLVPVAYFEVIGKQQRQSGQSVSSTDRTDHDSGFSENGSTAINARLRSSSNTTATAKPAPDHGGAAMSAPGKHAGAMVYGVVQYDFNAEREDELEAKAGEAIIVVAQSNPEWFVAKPIGRLGGPGLIPVSFVDIKDTLTMQSVADPLEAVRKAGVPRVEEWKRFAAEYKNSSISLGKFDNGVNQVTEGMGRMSVQQLHQLQQQQGRKSQSTQSMQTMQAMQAMQAPQQTVNSLPLAPVSASVPRYCFDNDTYWYIIECQMEDGRYWELSRYYADFYDFQIALIETFPKEAGAIEGIPRTLPFMPGPVQHVTDAISNGRRQNLDEYIKGIIAMPPHISKSMLVRNLFKPRPNQDFEMDPNAMHEDYRLSGASQQSVQRLQSPFNHPQGMRASHQRQQGSITGTYGNGYAEPMLQSQSSNLTQASHSSKLSNGNGTASGPIPGTGTGTGAGGVLKIKVFFQEEIIALRVPHNVAFRVLKERLVERLKVKEDILIQYKDEPTNAYIDLDNDDSLDLALQRNPKLTLFVNYAAA
ncbi:hypothetical protein DV738_g4832, partial [Chaetothyriales sp. CBS 135597]